MIFNALRAANVARQKEWDSHCDIDLTYRSNEMAGEVGEALERAVDLLLVGVAMGRAANIAKKIQRARFDIRGSRATKEQLAEELADIIICTDLIAMHEDIDLGNAVREKFNQTSEKVGLQTRIS